MTRSVKLDEREVNGIYEMQEMKPEVVIHVTKDSNDMNIHHHLLFFYVDFYTMVGN